MGSLLRITVFLLLLWLIPQPVLAIRNDPFFSEQWYLTQIQAPEPLSVLERSSIIVAVLDSGVDVQHPDLVHQLFVASGVDVINLSFASDANDPDLIAALLEAYRAGVVVVAAVGNGANGGKDLGTSPVFPACAKEGEIDLVIGVGATDKNDEKAAFSNFNSSCVDLSAPGTDIFGAAFARSGTAFTDPYKGYWAGTSFAAPLVSAAAATLLAAHPTLSPEQIKQILQLAVDPLRSTLFSTVLGAGRLNIARALELAPQFVTRTTPTVRQVTRSVPPTAVWQIDGHQGFAWFVAGEEQWQTLTAYTPRLPGGVFATAADIDRDGIFELLTIPRTNQGGPQVRVWSQQGVLLDQFFLGEETERGGWFVVHAKHPVHGEVFARLQPGTNKTEASLYRVSDRAIVERFTIDMKVGSVAMTAAGDEIVVGGAAGTLPRVERLSLLGEVQASFLAYDERFLGGVNVAALDKKIVVVPGPGGGPHVRLFSGSGVPERDRFVADPKDVSGLSVQTVVIAGESFIALRSGALRTQTLWSSTLEPVSFLHPSF